jgi:hypothetical protein
MRWTVAAAVLSSLYLCHVKLSNASPTATQLHFENQAAMPAIHSSSTFSSISSFFSGHRAQRPQHGTIHSGATTDVVTAGAKRRRLACGVGQYGSGTTCKDCPLGQFGELSNCDDVQCCKRCGKGEYTPDKKTSCKNCEPGKYQEHHVAREYQCKRCPDTMEFVSAETACRECPAGQYTNASAVSPGASPCSACPSGMSTGLLEGQTACFPNCTSQSGTSQSVNPCVPPKNTNPCIYGEEYYNNSELLDTDRCVQWYVRTDRGGCVLCFVVISLLSFVLYYLFLRC